ncbi:MAG: hypothetical protein HY273_10415 [Gammaproteobacteria bacterium]|nr:hypothetical protein [Gammaproteobacteria bacterium]
MVTHNGVIYMLGGVDGHDFLSSTEFARVQPDGTLTSWQAGPALLEARGFVEAAVHDNWIYIAGGGNGPNGHNLLRSVERARIQADGSLGPWIAETNTMVMPRRCSKIVATAKGLYSFGGFGGALLDSVEHAFFAADGSLGPWQLEPVTLTMPRYVGGVKGIGSDAYAIGGHDQVRGVGLTSVEWARVNTAGMFEKWVPTSPLQIARYGLSTATHADSVYALGGITGAEYVDSIERSVRTANGELGGWKITTPLQQPLASFSTIVHKDWIYVISGTNRDGYSRSVHYATFNPQGDLGYWGSKEQEQAYQQRLVKRQAEKTQLPNAGVVREVLHTQAYSYVLVESQSGSIWLAGPKTELTTGIRIRYSQGVSMTNFFSKELQRSFPEVLFVGTIVLE